MFDVQTESVLKHESPLGFRRNTLRARVDMLNSSDHRVTVSPDTGLVALIRPIDVLGAGNAPGGRLDAVVALQKGKSFDLREVDMRIRLSWFTRSRAFDARRLLPKSTIIVTTSSSDAVEDVAQRIMEAIDG
ncbi:hypothetical protein IT072_11985 [Leifsonia sp. ZF2019]|uniref:hypothetical protein n=1 Tax=Leifsonia sp. ZF2019 TaxID=2781978 RepID=UPI001CBD4FC0|nr:hypothetical protein [Leifsonia sp. ZF2019]UAJ78004.1 hypothetical protein IT072_11985 [Leifsonia sp. ZF2019]